MRFRLTGMALLMSAIAACAAGEEEVPPAETAGEEVAVETQQPGAAAQCQPMTNVMAVDGRVSPYDSVTFDLAGQEAKLCYGRPSMRGREIFGGLLPYDTLWRTGANEPTTIHLPVPAQIAGIDVDPGSYTIYTLPGQDQWTVIVNRSTTQWGIESAYTEDVRAQEVGRAPVPAEPTQQAVEQFTITAEPAGANGTNLVLEWENTRVRIPVTTS